MNDIERMARPLSVVDPEVYEVIQQEVERQHSRLELIASENFTSEAILQAAGSVFTNKYAEGYPGKRYYGGCEFADAVETLARERAKKLFGAEYVNVQPHSGSQANQAAYSSVIQPGDVILGDADGVSVIPAHLADEIANEAFEMTAFEDFVTEEVQKGRGIFGLYPATDEQTMADFAAWRKAKGR